MTDHGYKYYHSATPFHINYDIMFHDQQYLNDYFKNYWKPSIDAYQYSGYEIIAAKIKQHEWLLDVGCGHNPFKGLVKNVIGVDPAMDEADFLCTIEDFQPKNLFDVATCLGSINFGSQEVITRQIDKVVSCLKPQSRVYWRLNPGRRDHASEKCQGIPFFPWTHKILQSYAEKYNFRQLNEQTETNNKVIRLYAEWIRT